MKPNEDIALRERAIADLKRIGLERYGYENDENFLASYQKWERRRTQEVVLELASKRLQSIELIDRQRLRKVCL